MSQETEDLQMLDLFIRASKLQSPQTAKVYYSTLKSFLNIINKPTRDVTYDDLIHYVESLSHLQPATQKRMVTTVRSFFNFLSAQPNYLIYNPMVSFKNPKVIESDEIEHIMSKEDVEKIRSVLRYKNYRDYVIVSVLISTGLRLTEVTAAKWCDIQYDTNNNLGLTVVGKGMRKRTIKLSSQIINMIIDYRKKENLNIVIGDTSDKTPIFINKQGKSLSGRYIEKIVNQSAKIAKLSYNVHPHMFRHYNATMALYNGANLHTVQKSLGHKDISTTNRYLYSLHRLDKTTSDYVTLD